MGNPVSKDSLIASHFPRAWRNQQFRSLTCVSPWVGIVSVMIPEQCRLPGPSELWRCEPTKGLGGKGVEHMLIIGCDYHPGFQQIAFVETESVSLEAHVVRCRPRSSN